VASLRDDVEALAAIERGSASVGERDAALWLGERLEAAGASDVRLSEFRYQGTYAWAQAAHYAFAMLGGPFALAAAVSYDLDFSGRNQWLRRLLPAGRGTNVVARLPAAGERRRTLVLVAHHDAAHTGLIWSERSVRMSRGRSYGGVPMLAFALAALRRTRRAGRALLALGIALEANVARSPIVPGANDNATGVAVALALAERWARAPLPGCEVVVLLPGCEESGMGGMAAWLEEEGGELDPAGTLVLGLDTLGSGDPVVARAEGPPRAVRFREADLAIADAGARRAGLEPPGRVRVGGWTDPALSLLAGLPTISMLSFRDGVMTDLHRMTDTPERVDWGSVEGCLRLATGIGEEWAAQPQAR
jgi:hypothetical protein